MPSIVDNLFSCTETPLWFPNTFNISTIQNCESCILRLTADIPGVGRISRNSNGLNIEENPMTTLSVNGIQHNAIMTNLNFPGLHKLPGRREPFLGEINIYFQNIKLPNKLICIAIPLDVGTGPANTYFSTLTEEVRNDRPTMKELISKDATFISFDSVSLLHRNEDNSRPRELCEPPKNIVTYYLSLTPALLLPADFERLSSIYQRSGARPPKPTTDAMPDRLLKLCTRIQGIRIDSANFQATKSDGGGVSTKAMKCYKLDSEKDIVGDTVYVDGKNKPGTTLSDELMKAATDMSDDVDVTLDPPIKARDVERTIGIALGVSIALVITATIAIYVYKFIFKGYLQAQHYSGMPTLSNLAIPLPSLPGYK